MLMSTGTPEDTRHANGGLWWLSCTTSGSTGAGRRGGGGARCTGEDTVQPQIGVLRCDSEAEDHKGSQEHARIELGREQKVRGECAEVDEGGCAEGGGREDRGHTQGARGCSGDGVRVILLSMTSIIRIGMASILHMYDYRAPMLA